MNISSHELWNTIEVELIKLKNRDDLDNIMCQRFESLINHYNGNISNNNHYIILEELRAITSSLNSKYFYIVRNIDKDDIKKLSSLCENLMLLDKILVQERKNIKKEEVHIIKNRLPNILNDNQ